MTKHLLTMIIEKEALESEIFVEAQKRYSIGILASFRKGKGFIVAEIIEHGGHPGYPRFKVKNIKTKKEYWIDLDWLTRRT